MKAFPRTTEALREIADGFTNKGVDARTRSWLRQAARAEGVSLRQIKLLCDGAWATHGGYEMGAAGARDAAREALRLLAKEADTASV